MLAAPVAVLGGPAWMRFDPAAIEDDMRSIDDILADAQRSIAASFHEAFEAGRSHAATELKARMVAFFDGLAPSPEAPADDQPNGDSPSSEDHRHHDDHHHHD